MSFPARFFLYCLGLAISLATVALVYSSILDKRLSDAVAACKSESNQLTDAAKERAAKTPDSRINGFEFAGLVCDPLAFDMTDKVPPGAQGEMVLADRARSSFEGSFFLIAAILLSLVGILPASWYFLLRRLREVAAAIRGE